jgi:hypothetical protein
MHRTIPNAANPGSMSVLVMHPHHIIDAHPIMIISQTPSSHLADARLQATVNALAIIYEVLRRITCVFPENRKLPFLLFSAFQLSLQLSLSAVTAVTYHICQVSPTVIQKSQSQSQNRIMKPNQ